MLCDCRLERVLEVFLCASLSGPAIKHVSMHGYCRDSYCHHNKESSMLMAQK